ncbi:hypothetical protein [Bacteroides congonensis]|uniref:hypothetical protein n=1 Tax=Bacteroides congonensis TaxID=1871006 RepID=UPI000932F2FD|nr:hypothetical protein [Bacteroides congonensis]
MKKFLSEKLNNAKYEAIQNAKTTFKYLKEVRNNKLIQAIKEGKSNEQLKRISIDAIVDEIKFVIMSKGYSGKLENFDVDLFIFRNFKKSLFSVTSTDLKAIRAAVKSFNNVQRIRLDEFNFISVEYIESPVVPVAEEPVKDEAIQVEVEQVPIETLPVLYNKVVNDDIEEVEYEEVPNTDRKPSDFIRQQQRFVPNFNWGRLF